MFLIVDSGSTKSDMKWVENNQVVYECCKAGINPFYQDESSIFDTIKDCCPPKIQENTQNVFFYGAGCSFQEKCNMVKRPLEKYFPNAKVEVFNDLLGAARSLFKHSSGIACILGTGSNSCIYNGEKITKNVPPLGFILGDEGSGAVLGKLFISDILKGVAPNNIAQRFFDEENIDMPKIMEYVYKKSFPNRFLAQFSRHIYNHKDEEFFHELIIRNFDAFFARNINQYDKSLSIGLIGSIAHYFRAELEETAKKHNRSIQAICQSPVNGLIQYHK